MTRVGEQAGRLGEMLDRLAGYLEAEVDGAVSCLSSILEPALIVFLALAVGTVVISVLIPMFEIIATAA